MAAPAHTAASRRAARRLATSEATPSASSVRKNGEWKNPRWLKKVPCGMLRASIAQVSRPGAAANKPAVTGMAHRGITARKPASSMHGSASPAPIMKWVMADARSVPAFHTPPWSGGMRSPAQVSVVFLKPVFADGAEDVEVQGVFESHGAVRHVGGNSQHLTLSHDDFAAADFELERTLEDICDLLALVVVLRNNRALGEEDLRHHRLVARNDLARDGVAQHLFLHLVPRVEFHFLLSPCE